LSIGFTGVVVNAVSAQTGSYASAYQMAQAQAHAQAAAYQNSEQQAAAHHLYQQQLAAYHARQQAYLSRQPALQRQAAAPRQQPAVRPVKSPRQSAASSAHNNLLRFDGHYAAVPITFPAPIQHAVHAANVLQGKPYRMGGGHHRVEDSAYDCSGSVSYVLIRSGLLRSPLSSKAFAHYGQPGPGRFITLYVNPDEHVFMTVCGLRLDTTGGREGEGPRWRPTPRSASGFVMRHPAGL
jgi:hypothetical protein